MECQHGAGAGQITGHNDFVRRFPRVAGDQLWEDPGSGEFELEWLIL